MEIPTGPIGSIPRLRLLIDALRQQGHGAMEDAHLEKLYDDAVRDTVAQFEAMAARELGAQA